MVVVITVIALLVVGGGVFWFTSKVSGSWTAVQKELGLLFTHQQKDELQHIGVEGLIEDYEVRAIEEIRPTIQEDGRAGRESALDVTVGGDLPDLDDALACAIALPEAGWRYHRRQWHRTDPKRAWPKVAKVWIQQGVGYARALRSASDIPARLFEVLARPDGAPHHATALRHLLSDPAQRARALALAKADTSGRLGLVAARHDRDLAAVGAIAGGASAVADEALEWLVTEHPEAVETVAAVAARVERLGSHTPVQIRAVIAGIRRTSLPPRGVDAPPRPAPASEDALVSLMEHKDEEVGLMAIEALRDIGTARALGPIDRLAGSGGVRGHVARSAKEAIGQRAGA